MNKQKVWIHCRGLSNASRNLLDYQEEVLTQLAEKNGLKIVGITKEIASGKSLESFEIRTLITHIKRNKIDVILVTSKKRITRFDDLYEEFKLLCDKHNVTIISLQEIEDKINKVFFGF